MDELDRYPARRDVPWDEIDGRVVISLPKARSATTRLALRLFGAPRNTIATLEDDAARFWLASDGARTLREMIALLGRSEAAALAFARDLHARGFLELRERAGPIAQTLRGLPGFARPACRKCGVVTPVRAKPGAPWLCPRCRRLNLVPREPGANRK